ncbi:MAG: O-antigen ligase family protein, partial [Candidatus Omnitrophota bacterium]|nr:O-antigen ligase family protein [Candidatus Omnitrophota bacterium]
PNIFLLLFLLFSALSLFNSGAHLKISLNALFGKWLQYLGICIIIQDGIYNQKIIKRGIAIFLFSAALVVLSGLSQYLFGVEFLRGNVMATLNNGTEAITSSFSHYNAFGGYLVVVLSLVCALLLKNNYPKLKIFSLSVLAILSTVTIIFTFSRGSWLATFISFIFIVIFSKGNIKRLIPVFLLVAALFLLPVFSARLSLTFKPGGDSDRFRYWLVALDMIKAHPFFGVGAGTFMANFAKYLPNYNAAYAHNCYLQIWAETGIFALLSFSGFIFSFLYLAIRRFIVLKDFVLLGLLAGAVGFLVHSFFDTNFYSLRLAFLFWVWIGLILTLISQKQEE